MTKLHISISAEPIFHLGGFAVTNSMVTGVIVTAFLGISAYLISHKLKSKKRPVGLQNLVETVFEGLLNLMIGIAGEKKAKYFFPAVTTIFLFVLFSNWFGLLPGVGTIGLIKMDHGHESFVPFIRPPSADLNATLALALFSVIGTQVIGYKFLKGAFFKRYINLKNPMDQFLGFLEIVSEFSKILSFSFRLFGNIFAGEVLLTVMLALLPFLAPLPFIGLEIFVGFIQALVFAVLTLVFWNMATQSHAEEH